MSNAVYNMTLQALAQSVSDRAAEALLTAALREHHVTAEEVSAAEMQQILSGPLIHRLSTILPPARARAELRALSEQLAREYPKAPTLFTDIGAFTNWDEVEPTVTAWHGTGDLSSEASPTQDAPAWATGAQDSASDFEADDFEFDDPEYAAPLQGRQYTLADPAEQDALIRDLGRMQGVQGVMVTRASGEILRVKAIRDTSRLGSVIAATAMLLRQRGLKLMSANLGGQTVCMRPLGDYSVAVMAGPQVNIGRLLAELQQLGAAP